MGITILEGENDVQIVNRGKQNQGNLRIWNVVCEVWLRLRSKDEKNAAMFTFWLKRKSDTFNYHDESWLYRCTRLVGPNVYWHINWHQRIINHRTVSKAVTKKRKNHSVKKAKFSIKVQHQKKQKKHINEQSGIDQNESLFRL